MSTISLGTISPGKISLFKVTASVESGVTLKYEYHSGTLPPGLRIQDDGEIVGRCGEITSDRTYTFTVQVRNLDATLSARQQYQIKVKVLTADQVTNMNGFLRIDQSSMTAWKNFLSNRSIFPSDAVFRDYDDNFKTNRQLKFLFLSGVHSSYLSVIRSYMINNNYNTRLFVGDVKIGKAKGPDGTVLYEIIYAELVDPVAGAPNKITLTSNNLPAITVQLRADSINLSAHDNLPIPGTTADDLYINSIENMQNEIKDGLTVENFEYLPLWMKSPQDDKLVPGFKLALPIQYVKAGRGAEILYKIKNQSSYDLKSLSGLIDRWEVDKNIGTTIDAGPYVSTHTGDGSTRKFAIPYDVARSNSLKVTVGGIETDTQTTRNIRADTTTIYGDSSTVGGLDTADTTNTQTNTQSFTFQAEFITNTTADTSDTLSDNGLALADTNLTSKELAFNTAPVNGSSIVITLKPTTFGLNTTTTFDDGAGVETTFDTDGTVFTNDLVTFDRKNVQNTQIIMQRSSITDRITHVSKQRELVRTV